MSPDEFHRRLFVTLSDMVFSRRCPAIIFAMFVSGSEVAVGMERAAWEAYHGVKKTTPRVRMRLACMAAIDEGKTLSKMAVASFFGHKSSLLEPRPDRDVTVVQLAPKRHERPTEH